MPADPHLTDLMRQAIHGRQGVREKRMFGGVCWLLNGNLLCGQLDERYLFRVGKARQAEALQREGASTEGFGRSLTGSVWVDPDAAIDAPMEDWIAFAAEFVLTLPPK
jgi:hypothetical protein